ncbi:MAG: hypothetical protein IMW89_11585 [Ktedonobacteraceae bacterium]|nr:hypothetical protein [Ktedonobacteraceae bacterium]
MQWAVATAAFLASAVEFVEAFTIVLVVGVTINWRSSLIGAFAAAATLVAIVGTLGVALVQFVPLDILRLVVGVLLILFGLKWLKKAILRYSGLKALHDEEAIFEETRAELRARGEHITPRVEPFGVALSYKAVLLEGLEVAFIVITFGSSAATATITRATGITSAAIGAALAGLLVILTGALVRAPLTRVPENTLKFVVGIMLTTFGTFWAGEGFGIEWPFADVFLFALAAIYLVVATLLITWLKQVKLRKEQNQQSMHARNNPARQLHLLRKKRAHEDYQSHL